MREIKKCSYVPYDNGHHEYNIVNGEKVYKSFPVRYFYLDKYGILHVTKWEDIASKYGAGKYLVTDERLINSIPLTVTGADKEKLYFGKTKEPYSYIFGKTHNNEYCKFLAGVYMELENA